MRERVVATPRWRRVLDGRLLAARKLGLADVPVIRFEHLSDAQKRAYLIADNQLACRRGGDDALLAKELGWLRDERFDLGFDASEFERLLAVAGRRGGVRRGRGRGSRTARGAGYGRFCARKSLTSADVRERAERREFARDL